MPAMNRASMRDGWRRFRAIAAACIRAAFYVALSCATLFAILAAVSSGRFHDVMTVSISIALAGFPIALIGTVVIGIPVHFLLRSCQARSIWFYLGAGAIMGGLIMAGSLLLWTKTQAPQPASIMPAIAAYFCLAIGAPVAAVTLWNDLVRRVGRQQSAADLVSLF